MARQPSGGCSSKLIEGLRTSVVLVNVFYSTGVRVGKDLLAMVTFAAHGV